MSVAERSASLPAIRPLRAAQALPAIALAGVGALLIGPAFAHAVAVWSTTEEFSFGFLIIPVVVVLVWRRRRVLLVPTPGVDAGLALVVPALLLYLVATRAGIHAVAGLAVIPMLWGAVLYLRGQQAARQLAFPIGYLAFGLGLYRGLLDSVGFGLQSATARIATIASNAVGLGVQQDGLVLTVKDFGFLVSQQCSGMSSLVSLLALSALWVYLADARPISRGAVVVAVLPIVLIANGVRVTLVLAVASAFGVDAAVGFFHGASSFVLFAVAVAGLLAVGRMVGCKAPTFER